MKSWSFLVTFFGVSISSIYFDIYVCQLFYSAENEKNLTKKILFFVLNSHKQHSSIYLSWIGGLDFLKSYWNFDLYA